MAADLNVKIGVDGTQAVRRHHAEFLESPWSQANLGQVPVPSGL